MRKIIVIILFLIVGLINANTEANAFDLRFWDDSNSYEKQLKQEEKEVRTLLHAQLDFVNKQNIVGLSELYANDFVNNDGFNKDVYFKLVEDTWNVYPDITYSAKIRAINVQGKFATAVVDEKAIAVAYDVVADVKVVGELYSTSKCIYYFEKTSQGWKIKSENVLDEISALKYGDARYIDIHLNTPKQIAAGNYYTSSLVVDVPENVMAVVAISRETISYPQKKAEESFRLLPDDNILERIFLANSDNVNEYNIASVATSRAYEEDGQTKVVMSGAAFIMSRVNVVPENKMINMEAEDAKL